jgi:uncharacterized membrane protein
MQDSKVVIVQRMGGIMLFAQKLPHLAKNVRFPVNETNAIGVGHVHDIGDDPGPS